MGQSNGTGGDGVKAEAGAAGFSISLRRWPVATLACIALLAAGCHRDATPETGAAVPPAKPAPEAKPDPPPPSDATDAPDNAATPTRFVLAPGQSVELAVGTTLSFERVVDDSRCPAGVQCIWAGEVRIALSLRMAGGTQAFELSTSSQPQVTQGGYRIGLLTYGACPKDHGSPAGSECATLDVQPADGETTEADGSAAAPATSTTP